MAGSVNNIIAGGATITSGSDLGYIQNGVILSVTSEPLEVMVEGINTPITYRFPKVVYEISTTLAEPTMANLQIALDWSNTSATGASGNTLTFGAENYKPTFRAVTIFGYVPGSGGFTRQIVAGSAIAIPGGESKYTDAEITTTPLTLRLVYNATVSGAGQLIDGTS